jgi:WD40 repeat protein
MTVQKHFKAIVRARMARTGETYTAARAALEGELQGIRLERVATLEAHDRHCIAVRFAPNGRELLSGGFGGQARIWSTTDWSRAGELVGHTESVNGFAFDARGSRVVTVSSDGTVRLWELGSRREIATLNVGRKTMMAVDIRRDGAHAATGGFDGVVRLHALDEREDPPAITVGGRVMAVAFTPDGQRVAVASAGVGVRLITPEDGSVEELPPADAVGVRWAPDGAFLVVTEPTGAVSVLDVNDWSEVRRLELKRSGMMPSAATRDSALVAIGWEKHVGVWRADEDEPAATVDALPKGVYALDFSPDGRLLAQGGADGRVRVWRVRAGAPSCDAPAGR